MKLLLSVDGGGIRGIIPARILSWMWKQLNLLKGSPPPFDLIAGTSTGGILAAGLAHTKDGKTATYSPDDLLNLYLVEGPGIFKRAWFEPAALLKVKYPASQIEPVLQRYYGDVKLSASLTDILITAFDQAKWKPRLFKSREARAGVNPDVPLWYASRATSAAPTYFPNLEGLLDGGVIGATNPSMLALTEARIAWPGEEVFLLSIGTGTKDASVDDAKSEGWGELAYLSSLIGMLLDGPEKTVERMVSESIPAANYVRIQGQFVGSTPSHAFDNASPSNNQALVAFADKIITDSQVGLEQALNAISRKG